MGRRRHFTNLIKEKRPALCEFNLARRDVEVRPATVDKFVASRRTKPHICDQHRGILLNRQRAVGDVRRNTRGDRRKTIVTRLRPIGGARKRRVVFPLRMMSVLSQTGQTIRSRGCSIAISTPPETTFMLRCR